MATKSGKSEPLGVFSTTWHGGEGPWTGYVDAEIDGFPGWIARARIEVDENARTTRVTQVTVEPWVVRPPRSDTQVTANMLRAVRLPAMLRVAERALENLSGKRSKAVAAALHDARAGGRPREITDERLAKLAHRYVQLLNQKAPLQALAAEERGLNYERARALVELARDRGLLSGTIRGRKGGHLTAAGQAALKKGKARGTR